MTEHAESGTYDHHHHTPDEIRAEMRKYWWVFGWLLVFTGITVGVCYGLDLPVHYAVLVAMIVALIKGSLVAGFFMHLISEKKLIYGILIVTVLFFIVLMSLPVSHYLDKLHY